MVGYSDFLQNAIIDFLFRSFSFPSFGANIYIGLLNVAAINTDTGTTIMAGGGGTGQEPSAFDYVRNGYGPSPTQWSNTQNSGSGASTGSSGTTMNNNVLTWPTAAADWGTIVGVAFCDASTGGNLLFFGDLASPISIGIGDTFAFDINTLQVILECP